MLSGPAARGAEVGSTSAGGTVEAASDGLITVAALFVDEAGVYAEPGLSVEVWGESRDARRYRGPWPVVAHPPCNVWSSLAPINAVRWGSPLDDDGGCFASALGSLRRFGGVLEHPAQSRAWARHDLPRPYRGFWSRSLTEPRLWVTEVSQVVYGHLARKRTWLAYIGDVPPAPLRWFEVPARGTVGGGYWRRSGRRSPGVRVQRRLAWATPIAFRNELLALSRGAV